IVVVVGSVIVIVRVRIIVAVPVGRRAVAIIRKAIIVEVVVRVVRIVRRPPRRKSQIEDHPCSIDEGASVTVPPVVMITVPIAMPISRSASEHVLLPVAPQTIVSVPEIETRSLPSLLTASHRGFAFCLADPIGSAVYVPLVISIPELSVSLVPNACSPWISAIHIRRWRDTVALRDRGDRIWTGPRNQRSIRVVRPLVREGSRRTHPERARPLA